MATTSLFVLLIVYRNVFTTLAEQNVAVGRQTNQSSTQYGGVSSRAVDGNTYANYYNGSCSHTADAGVNWWCVDLEESIDVERVKIYNLKFNLTKLQYRLKAFEIKLSSNGSCNKPGFDSATACYKNPNTIQDVYTIEECNQGNQGTTTFTGRFVFIGVNNDAPGAALPMCEVEIFEKCSINCKNDICDTSGVCNGCNDGRYGNQCNQSCSTQCNGGCNQVNGICNGCINGRYGNQCDKQCNTYCNGGCNQVNGICNGCIDGRYGEYCNNSCSDGCLSNQCIKSDGTCSCQHMHYDAKCTSVCSTNCKDELCFSSPQNPSQPRCSSGCIDGYKGSYCQVPCPTNCLICDTSSCSVCNPGWYGTNCKSKCSMNCIDGCQILEGKCNQCKPGTVGDFCNKACGGCLSNGSLPTCDRNSVCHHGCIDGKSGSTCDKMCKQHCTVCQNNDINSCLTCTDGRFGVACDELCNTNCASTEQESKPICNITTGLCTLGCKNGFYGNNCKTSCNAFCWNIVCDYITGLCSEGCVAGKTGITCLQECHDGWYGVNCSSTCGKCADNIRCDKATGSCGLVGCQEGYTGPKCQTEGTGISSISPLVAGIIGALSATSCSFLICFMAYCIYRRRKSITRESCTRTKDNLQMQSNIGCADRIDGTEDYQNISPETTINHPTHPTVQSEYETLGQRESLQYEVLD